MYIINLAGALMRDFITCLEFLTRIRFSNRTDWRDDDFSRSVPYFPLVGLVIGLFLGAANYILLYFQTPLFMRAVMLILAEIVIIGGLMYDGFMDTSDSHVGSNAVIALVCLVLLKIAAYTSIDGQKLTIALIAMSAATRTFMVNYIVNFKYARKTGIGHMFTSYAKPAYSYIAFIIGTAILLACGLQYFYAGVAAFVLSFMLARYLAKQLGGLTGDTYGFLTECGNIMYLLAAVYILR